MSGTKLGYREQRALMLVNGLFDDRHRTLAETGKRMGITRERVRQVLGIAQRKLAGPETDSERLAEHWAKAAVWAEIDGFEDIIARPMLTFQGLAERMPALVEKVRAHRLERARQLAFEALWPRDEDNEYSGDGEEDAGSYEDEGFEDELLSEWELAYKAFELSPAQRDLVARAKVDEGAVIKYLLGPGRPLIKDGMPGIALPRAFGLRMSRLPYARRYQVSVVLGQETEAVNALAEQLIRERLAEPEGQMFSDFLSFWAEERYKYAAPAAVRAVEGGAIALVWPSIVERDERVLLDATDFRARRDALAKTGGALVVQELIWAGFGAWVPPQGLVTAVAEFRAFRLEPDEYQGWQARTIRRKQASERHHNGDITEYNGLSLTPADRASLFPDEITPPPPEAQK